MAKKHKISRERSIELLEQERATLREMYKMHTDGEEVKVGSSYIELLDRPYLMFIYGQITALDRALEMLER